MSVLANIRQQPTLAYYYAQKAVRNNTLRAGAGLAGHRGGRVAPGQALAATPGR
jgi:hypothetical protein